MAGLWAHSADYRAGPLKTAAGVYPVNADRHPLPGVILAYLIISAAPRYREKFHSDLIKPGMRRLPIPLLLIISITAILIVAIGMYCRRILPPR